MIANGIPTIVMHMSNAGMTRIYLRIMGLKLA
jgi:hypothetical protein